MDNASPTLSALKRHRKPAAGSRENYAEDALRQASRHRERLVARIALPLHVRRVPHFTAATHGRDGVPQFRSNAQHAGKELEAGERVVTVRLVLLRLQPPPRGKVGRRRSFGTLGTVLSVLPTLRLDIVRERHLGKLIVRPLLNLKGAVE